MSRILFRNILKTSTITTTGITARRRTTDFTRSIMNNNGSRLCFSSNIRDAGGAFGKKEKAEEERWIYEHEKEVLKSFKDEVAHKHDAEEATVAKSQKKTSSTGNKQSGVKVDAERIQPTTGIDSTYGGSVRAGGGAFGRKEAAVEEKYFREHDQELLHKLKEDKDHNKKKH